MNLICGVSLASANWILAAVSIAAVAEEKWVVLRRYRTFLTIRLSFPMPHLRRVSHSDEYVAY
jgi:hypothetical protein